MDPKILKQQQKAYNKAYGAFKRAHRLNLFEWIVVRIYLICYLARRLADIIKAELTVLKNKISPQTPPTEEDMEEDLISISWPPERECQKERECQEREGQKEKGCNTLEKFRAELLLFGQKVSSRLKIIIKNFIAAGKKVVNFIKKVIKKAVAAVTKIIKIVSKFISSRGIFFFLLVSVIILSCIINYNERELKMQQLRYDLLVSDSGKIQGPVLHVSNFHLENLVNGTIGNNIVYNRTRHSKINDSINSIINQNTNSITYTNTNQSQNSNPQINTTGQGAIEVTQESVQENSKDSSSLIVTSPASIEGPQQGPQQEQQEQHQEQIQQLPTSMVPVAVRKEFIWNKVFELTSTPGGRFENFFIIRTQDRTFQPQREMLYEVIIEGYYDTLLYIGSDGDNGSNGGNGKRVTQKDLLAARDIILSECESFATSAVGYWRDEGFLSTDIVVNFLDEYDTENVMYVYKNGVLNYSRYDTQIKELDGYDENDDMYIEDECREW